MENTEIFISVNESKIRTSDGYEYNLTPHFLYLYYYLALKRLHDPAGTGGYADTTEIISLPYWERNDLESIGKQIRRHIVDMEKEGRNIIEAQQKIKGPFRLILSPDRIKIDVPISRLMDVLDVRHIEKLTPKQESDFYKYVECMWEGNVNFDRGYLDKALALYGQASDTAINTELKLAALHKTCVTLDRLGNFKDAENITQDLFTFKGLDEMESATANVLEAWVKLRLRQFKEAEKLYFKGLDMVRGRRYYRLMGNIYNGLGLIRKERGQYDEALVFYQRALEYWSLVDYFYGIQAVYFNIGNLYYLWGKRSKMASYYDTGIEWVERCRSLCETVHISYDTSQDHILLAGLYKKIKKMDKALDYAQTALKMATDAGNKRDIAYSYRILGKVYLEKGMEKQAASAFDECLKYLKLTTVPQEELREREEEIRKLLDQ